MMLMFDPSPIIICVYLRLSARRGASAKAYRFAYPLGDAFYCIKLAVSVYYENFY
jgi:hypothetical protein